VTFADFLAGCDFWYAPLLWFPVICWIHERGRIRNLVQQNKAGLYCHHGNRKSTCRTCAEAFFNTSSEPPAAAATSIPAAPPASPILAFAPNPNAEAFRITQGPHTVVNGRKLPLRIDVPDFGPNHRPEISLSITTNSLWSGCATKIGIQTKRMLVDYCANIPACISNWMDHLSQRFGPDIQTIFIPDHEGIDRITLRINGELVVDASPAVLLAMSHLRPAA
jgi:hypothetical protein